MRRIGVIGLGAMGTALTKSLLAAGYSVSCWDRRVAAAAPLAELGARVTGSARELAAEVELVLTFLPGPAQVREVALDPVNGVLAGLERGAAMLDMSTCEPDLATELDAEFRAVGRKFADCPVSRQAPRMTVLVGGPRGSLGAAEPVLTAAAEHIVYCGRIGSGYATKLLNQQIKYTWYLASAEALATARKLGLDPAVVVDAVRRSSGGDAGFANAAEYFLGDDEAMRTHAPASTIEKDMLLAEAMTARAGTRSRMLAPVVDFFRAVAQTPWRSRPFPESCALLETMREDHR
ncbi:NAD(P)-dependent oxidoreductase [Saccharopolyspora sp. K220]|uniref:NAD(P)-dependent oxidoreductase n=1 Tax=Saccharopolyspora soli TaxID=2926618 RepID=UPI001F58920E|nr:NAD(P)-dependent oxidoreductase [Saccharopolyspora soli]MCI2418387.1 NAD(P)-dependent oxidoreductase [Saccharopolyspora soli]